MNEETDSPLRFPCDFPIKAMGAGDEDFRSHVVAVVEHEVGAEAVKDVQTRDSRGGKYLSVTVTLRARDREQLDNVYRALHASDRVLMTL